MNTINFYNLLALALTKYFPEEMDESLKPPDSSGCLPCNNITFDYIIVGAGSAGCVLANRLSADNRTNVLLIEAGDNESYQTDTPALFTNLFNSKYDWNYTTVSQKYICRDIDGECPYPRGFVMGGSSTINGMVYARGNPSAYDEWRDMGNRGWAYQDVLPYFLKAEGMTIASLMNSSYHSTKGPLTISYSSFDLPLFRDIIQTVKELYGLPEADYNGATQTTIGYTQHTIRGPVRCSSSKAYLDPIMLRKNLYIFKNTVVTKLIFDEFEPRRVIGVRFIKEGRYFSMTATKEVMLSAGAINTPKLLMLSGIGPKNHLKEVGIPVRIDLPVGQHLMDNAYVPLLYFLNKTQVGCCEESLEKKILEYARDRKGPYTSPPTQLISFLNSQTINSSKPDLQISLGLFTNEPQLADISMIHITLLNLVVKSVGTLKLRSKNFQDPPLINPNVLAVGEEMQALVKGLRLILEVMGAPQLASYTPMWLNGEPEACMKYNNASLSDDFLECFVNQVGSVGLHAVGTARMGPPTDNKAVVDDKLKVHNVLGLRVVDASIMPSFPRSPTNAPTIMIAEKAADLILEDAKQGPGL